jgi:hypothetical protein
LAEQQEDPGEASIGELFHQLVEEGREVARTEINLYRQIALYRAQKAKLGAVALAAGAVLLLSALIVLLIMFAIGLAVYIGPFGAGLLVAGATALAGGLLLRFGATRVSVVVGDQEELAALRDGERKA